MIDCHVIYNEPTDREDWLNRCVQSLQHPAVLLHVHRFKESESIALRRETILRAHDTNRWVMFADPDDYVQACGFKEYVEFIRNAKTNLVWCAELGQDLVTGREWYSAGPHHLVALRGGMVLQCLPEGRPAYKITRQGAFYPYPVYNWIIHGSNTHGGIV